MQYVCENENEEVLRLLASNHTVKDLILRIGANTSSLAKLRNEGFDTKEMRELIEIGAINIENDHWLKNCVWKGDCTFLYLTAPLRLSEKGLGVFNRICHRCYCVMKLQDHTSSLKHRHNADDRAATLELRK
jgi:hypothetical protein